jgi:acyl-CoA thioesterase I
MIQPSQTIEKMKSGKPVTITAIGDSLTAGWMVRKGYIEYFKELILRQYPLCSLKIVNRGSPGDTADNGLYRLKWDLTEHKPDCVFIQYAINDASLGFTIDQFRGYVQGMIRQIQETGDADIVLITSSYIGDNQDSEYIEEFYRQLVILGNEYRLPVALVHKYWKQMIDESEVDYLSLVQYDMVHPTELGYRLMAEAIMQLFV